MLQVRHALMHVIGMVVAIIKSIIFNIGGGKKI